MTQKKSIPRRLLSYFLILVVLLAVLYQFGHKEYMKRTYPVKYATYIDTYAKEYGVDDVLIYAVIQTESGFEVNAVSEADAIGLMQMTEETFQWLQTKTGETLTFAELYNPETSIKYGTLFLSILLSTYSGDINTAMAAYHAGMGSVNSWLAKTANSSDGQTLDHIPASDTAHYVHKINHAMKIYANRLEGK